MNMLASTTPASLEPNKRFIGSTSAGYMYNSVYRTIIEDNEARKFLDTFVGPSITMASILRIVRNATFSLVTRISLDFFLPLTR